MNQTELKQTWDRYFEDKKSGKKDSKNKDRLIQHYFPYMQGIANKTAKSIQWKQSAQQLGSYGAQGLIKSIQKFDSDKQVKFQTYSFRKIRGAILDGLRQQDWVPRSVRKNYQNIQGARARLYAKLQRTPSEQQVFQELGIDFSEYTKSIKKFSPKGKCSLQASSSGDYQQGNKSFNSSLVHKCISPMSIQMRKQFFTKIIIKCKLTKQQSNLLLCYYYHNMTMKQISVKMKMSQSRISQMHKIIIDNISQQFGMQRNEMFDDVRQIYKAAI